MGAGGEAPFELQHLLDDLRAAELTQESHTAGRAEHAGHAAANLTREAVGDPTGAPRERHTFDARSVFELEQELGGPVAGPLRVDFP